MLCHALIALQTLLATPLRARRAAQADAHTAASLTAGLDPAPSLSAYLQNPESWSCRFPKARAAGLILHTSQDGRLRSFSWAHQGSRHTLLQSRSPGGHTQIHPALIPAGQIERLHTARLPPHGNAYLLLAEHSAGEHTEKSLHLFHFAAEQFQPLPLIQTTPDAEPTHRLHFRYRGRHANNYFFYDPGSHTISQPHISPHTHTPTQHRLRYRFNGSRFVPHH
ncbi:hypothetical protein A7P95_09630 [Eikenella longinqua]|uniref:Uncharacterized protein n=1 Tax=Eikenella longinqua TaxID=1795827 RepID=A0A1A9RUZ1_9NEIS|nr:hypothetical protein [Eikenella longinqua]OAM26430.1 hypothetical protein A7P95_09630 [Eikenella longinqua]